MTKIDWLHHEETTKAEAISALQAQEAKTQLSAEGTTSDCISRQAAIDVCNNAIDLWHGQLGEGIVIAVKKKIEQLPPAQPETHEERTETHACDLISRQKAFEYFVTLWECIGTIMDRDEWEDVCMTTANEIPSAQPERKKGKWKCIGFMVVECSECNTQLHGLECANFCPNCGSDMREETT